MDNVDNMLQVCKPEVVVFEAESSLRMICNLLMICKHASNLNLDPFLCYALLLQHGRVGGANLVHPGS